MLEAFRLNDQQKFRTIKWEIIRLLQIEANEIFHCIDLIGLNKNEAIDFVRGHL